MKVRLLFEPRDLWVGVYWDREDIGSANGLFGCDWRVYICVVPMLPIRISWSERSENVKGE